MTLRDCEYEISGRYSSYIVINITGKRDSKGRMLSVYFICCPCVRALCVTSNDCSSTVILVPGI